MRIRWSTLIQRQHIGAYGISSKKGFSIRLFSRGNECCFQTRNYEPTAQQEISNPRSVAAVFLFTGITTALFLTPVAIETHSWTKGPNPTIGILTQIIMMLAATVIMAYCCMIAFASLHQMLFSKETSEWHALEHQLISLIMEKQAITFENLSRAPSIAPTCGSSWFITGLQIAGGFWLYFYWRHSPVPRLFAAEIAFFLAISSVEIFLILRSGGIVKSKFVSVILLVPLVPSLILPLTVQVLCLLKKPSEKKVAETIADLEDFREKYQKFLASIPT